jgi:hypothetical protein
MTVIVAGQVLLSGLLALLVVGLLRSHAEILRRLEDGGRATAQAPHDSEEWDPDVPRPRDHSGVQAAGTIAGETLNGNSAHYAFPAGGQDTLIAFLSSGCAICGAFWEAFAGAERGLPRGVRLLIVTKDTSHESPSKLHALAPSDVPVVMSTSTWEAYGVPIAPYFVYVAGATGAVEGEGAAANWEQLRSLFRDFLFDAERMQGRHMETPRADVQEGSTRVGAIDGRLRDSGIGPGHPSLYDSPELPPEMGEPELVFEPAGSREPRTP